MLSRLKNLFRSKRRMDANELARLADDGGPLAATELTPPPVPTLSPFEPGPALLSYGWSEIVPNPGTPRPMLCLRVVAPADPDRLSRTMAAGVGGLVAKVRAEASGLTSVLNVQRLRRDLSAANARSREAQHRGNAAREERAGIPTERRWLQPGRTRRSRPSTSPTATD